MCLLQLAKKVPWGTFLAALLPPSILAEHKMLFSKSLAKQVFLSGGLQYSKGVLPPRAPPLLYFYGFSEFF